MHRIPTSLRALSIAAVTVLLATGALLLGPRSTGGAQTPTAAAASGPFTVEYYYKVRWGHFDEFMELYQRNHYPILQRQRQLGRIVSMTAAYPLYHASEGSRWDMRFTIVWKDAATAHDDFDASPIIRELYPDSVKFRAEEQRRFELLLEHTDVPVDVDDLSGWRR
jgi:hypothetical protein